MLDIKEKIMKKKKILTFILAILVILCVFLIIRVGATPDYEKSILSKDEIIEKIEIGMTIEEVYWSIGTPFDDVGSGVYILRYLSSDDVFIKLYFDLNNTLKKVQNDDGTDLLAKCHTADVVDFPVLINGERAVTDNPIVTINGRTYVPIKEMEEQLGINVKWNESMRKVEITA